MENKDLQNTQLEQDNNEQENPVVLPPQEDLDDLQTKVRNLPEAKWFLFQRIGGAVMGLLCGYLLTYFSAYESIGLYGTIAAVLIALLAPNMIEKRVKRPVQKGRFALMIALGVWLLGYLLIMLLSGTPLVGNPA
ncbi:MAG: hypothetical protein Q8S22_10870 [Eubacteriales bacterium]|nr:hypothetical protein [Eubacteriales bacterium]